MEEACKVNPLLVRKYSQPVARYTSYPTMAFWYDNLAPHTWDNIFKKEFNNHNHTEGISIHISFPFSGPLPNQYGCSETNMVSHEVEDDYLLAVEKEWRKYRDLMQQTPVIREIHLSTAAGFFSVKGLHRLLSAILKNSIIHPVYEFVFSGNPAGISNEQLEMLYAAGFRCVNFSVQNNITADQEIIDHMQGFESIKSATKMARQIGFTSVNFDLIYGSPNQTIESIGKTIQQAIKLMPDRISFHRYTQFTRNSTVQRCVDENDLPADMKINMYLKCLEMLTQHSYHNIGMNQFSLVHDNLYKVRQKGKLHRNLLGYSTQNTGLLLGLGVSTTSDMGAAYAINVKTSREYLTLVNNTQSAVKTGYILSEEDKLFRKNILDICCKGRTSFADDQLTLLEQYTFPELKILETDGLIKYDSAGLEVTPQGHFFTRNICRAFDLHVHRKDIEEKAIYGEAI